ncbi:MAG TPA: hypothetical protein PK875_05530 [Spirochaetota bacterium]|jgi:hypothetical protein|nr:MAG: hypothetical protein BWY96_00486 [Spirochaetes bacterium ADurb.BinA120]HPI13791.1 hypothetical protein [Spirochaetota bacterium]HPO45239.1 hypothetical protein [Spirochaetota bacterium]HPV96950.1 hypothetical protein [Spirochaetota bacterium]
MKISTGIAEVQLSTYQPTRIVSEKAFLWPAYNAGRITPIHGIMRQTESQAAYITPSPEERDRLLGELFNSPAPEYSANGRVFSNRYMSYQPGTFFDALA